MGSDLEHDFYPPPDPERLSSVAGLVPVGIVMPAFIAGAILPASAASDGWQRLAMACAGLAFLGLSMAMALATMFRLRQAAAWAGRRAALAADREGPADA